jgi:DNA-binding transcriptional ArsR family regulator
MVSGSLPFVMANVSAMLTALGDPTRQAIFERLSHGPLAVGQLAGALPVSRPAVSQHLRVLKDVGLVFDRQEGTRRLYQVDPEGLAQLRAHLDSYWERSLAAFANRTEERRRMDTIVEAIRREIVVEVDQATAFEIFTADMTSWWPPAHHIGSAPIQEVVIEPRVGGRWFTRHEDGTETDTGVVTAWEPPGLVGVTWQIGADWKFHTDLVTSVAVRFEPEGPERTRVLLEHSGLEAFGADAATMRDTFEADGAWTATIAAYAARVAR